jgi:hypothetical protein
MRSRPPSTCEPFQHSAHPLLHLFFFNIIWLDIGLLPPRRGPNQDRSLVCLLFIRPSRNWNHAILDALLFSDAENIDSTVQSKLLGRGTTCLPAICSFWDLLKPSQILPSSFQTVYLLLYTDDIVLTASSTELLQRTISALQQEFSMKDLG